MYSSYSEKFLYVADLYIKDGATIKNRENNNISNEIIENKIINREKVIIEKEKVLHCYFKKEDEFLIKDILKTIRDNDIKKNIVIE